MFSTCAPNMIKWLTCLIVLATVCYAQEETENTRSDITISYTLWIGTYLKRIHHIDISAPRNTTFYEVMQLAADENRHYQFAAKKYDFGHYVTEIDRVREIAEYRYHWMIYKLPAEPNPWSPPSDEYLTPAGVDGILIDDAEYYLFWYHKLKEWNPDQ